MASTVARANTGLVIGKFLPPHQGHLHLLATARARVAQLTVIVITKSHEPIPGHLRFAWMKRLLPNEQVLHVTDEHPVDFNDPAIWELWIQSIRRVYPTGPEVVFSSEDYGAELARRLGARHESVDPERRTITISGTALRADPMKYWDYLPPCVRPYFVKRLAIVGAESTGKTTLARDLASTLDTVWVPEFARGYLLAKTTPCAWEDMEPIARGQLASEESLAEAANRVLVCDTTLRVTQAWSEFYFERCAPWIAQQAQERPYDLHLVTDPHVPWQPDELRDSPHERQRFHARFLNELQAAGLPYVIVTGSPVERVRQVVAAIQPMLTRPTLP